MSVRTVSWSWHQEGFYIRLDSPLFVRSVTVVLALNHPVKKLKLVEGLLKMRRKGGFRERLIHGFFWLLVSITLIIVAPFSCFSVNRSRTLSEQLYDEVNVLVALWKFPVCFFNWSSLHSVFLLKTSLLQILRSLQINLPVTSSDAFAGLSLQRSHSCLITREQVVSFRNQYRASRFNASTTRGGGKNFGHLAIDRHQLEGDCEKIWRR